jgi:hypothetical protein
LGDPEFITEAFTVLVTEEKVRKLAQDIYVTYRNSEYGKIFPSPESIVNSLVKKHGKTIVEIGASAINRLGLSTQNIMSIVCLTDSEPMKLECSGGGVEIRKGTKVQMLLGKTLEGSVIRAWDFYGEEESTKKLELLPTGINWDVIINASNELPEWMGKLAAIAKKMQI